MRLFMLEVRHRLSQLDEFGMLPSPVRRLLLDETIPGAGITVVPAISAADFLKLLDHPTKTSLGYWILKGERSIWPAIGALKVRCAVEVELDRGYQFVRRRKPLDGEFATQAVRKVGSRGSLKRRRRAASLGQGEA